MLQQPSIIVGQIGPDPCRYRSPVDRLAMLHGADKLGESAGQVGAVREVGLDEDGKVGVVLRRCHGHGPVPGP